MYCTYGRSIRCTNNDDSNDKWFLETDWPWTRDSQQRSSVVAHHGTQSAALGRNQETRLCCLDNNCCTPSAGSVLVISANANTTIIYIFCFHDLFLQILLWLGQVPCKSSKEEHWGIVCARAFYRSDTLPVTQPTVSRHEGTRKQKHHLEGNAIPAGYCHMPMLLYMSGVNYNENSNCTKYLAQLRPIFLCFGKFPPHICESCGATYRYNYETFSDL